MTTFSQLVDKIVTECRRPDMRDEISTYLNQTIREIHFEPTKGNAVFYDANRIEEQVTATLDSGQSWDIPVPQTFQAMLDVTYANVFVEGSHDPLRPPFLSPGRGMNGQRWFYYRAGGTFFFKGYGGIGALINMCYYAYPKRLLYFAAGARPCEWDDNAGWTYAAEFSGTPQLNAAAQAFCTNWLLDRWEDVVSEGLRAKVYKRLSDDSRARTCYSMYSQLRQGLFTSESSQLGSYGS